MPGRGSQGRGGLWCSRLRRGAVSTCMTTSVCLRLCPWGHAWCPGSLAGPSHTWVADLTLAPRHLTSHFMEALFGRPLKCYLAEATEQIQATCCRAADALMNRQCWRVCHAGQAPRLHWLGSWACPGLTIFWKSHELRGLTGKADPPGVTGTDSELVRTPGTEVFNDKVSVQGRSHRLLPGLGT